MINYEFAKPESTNLGTVTVTKPDGSTELTQGKSFNEVFGFGRSPESLAHEERLKQYRELRESGVDQLTVRVKMNLAESTGKRYELEYKTGLKHNV
jgi:hypothetical protein